MSVAEGTAWADSSKIDWRLLLVQETSGYWLVSQPDTTTVPATTAAATASRLQALVAPARRLLWFMRPPPSSER